MRNFITAYFNEDTPLLCMDDDIIALYKLYEDTTIHDTNKSAHWKLKEMTPVEFYNWTFEAYNIMINNFNIK